MKTFVAVVVLTFSSLVSAQAWNHDPASPIGPLHWGKVAPSDATCGDSSRRSTLFPLMHIWRTLWHRRSSTNRLR
jgi:hypothetical protein